jgi:hypothetical protein
MEELKRNPGIVQEMGQFCSKQNIVNEKANIEE